MQKQYILKYIVNQGILLDWICQTNPKIQEVHIVDRENKTGQTTAESDDSC